MTATLNDLVDSWLLEEDSDDLLRLRDQLTWLRKHLFGVYEPEQFSSFDDRLVGWLQNVPDGEDRRTLFRLLGHLFFVAEKQFYALCMTTFNDAIVRWLLDQLSVDLRDPELAGKLATAKSTTWFCPMTDSMRIGTFLKVNKLAGHDVRTDWRSLEVVGDQQMIRQRVADEGIERIVFLEDFVGSGDQMRSTVLFARHTLPDMPILLAPLICCPEGLITGELLANRYRLTFAPTLSLREELFVLPTAAPGEPDEFSRARNLISRVQHRLGAWREEPFGHADTGALVATWANCPDNTLPIVHEDNAEWKALFPRIRRE